MVIILYILEKYAIKLLNIFNHPTCTQMLSVFKRIMRDEQWNREYFSTLRTELKINHFMFRICIRMQHLLGGKPSVNHMLSFSNWTHLEINDFAGRVHHQQTHIPSVTHSQSHISSNTSSLTRPPRRSIEPPQSTLQHCTTSGVLGRRGVIRVEQTPVENHYVEREKILIKFHIQNWSNEPLLHAFMSIDYVITIITLTLRILKRKALPGLPNIYANSICIFQSGSNRKFESLKDRESCITTLNW